MGYVLSDGDIQQLINRYNNAKNEYNRLRSAGDPEWKFECGRAYGMSNLRRIIHE